MYGCINAAAFAYEREHGSNGRLAVAAGNADNGFVSFADKTEGNGTFYLRDTQFRCADAFGVIGFYRSGIYDGITVFDIFGIMPYCYGDACFDQSFGKRGSGFIRARDSKAPAFQNLSQSVHRAAAYAYKMHSAFYADIIIHTIIHAFLPAICR